MANYSMVDHKVYYPTSSRLYVATQNGSNMSSAYVAIREVTPDGWDQKRSIMSLPGSGLTDLSSPDGVLTQHWLDQGYKVYHYLYHTSNSVGNVTSPSPWTTGTSSTDNTGYYSRLTGAFAVESALHHMMKNLLKPAERLVLVGQSAGSSSLSAIVSHPSMYPLAMEVLKKHVDGLVIRSFVMGMSTNNTFAVIGQSFVAPGNFIARCKPETSAHLPNNIKVLFLWGGRDNYIRREMLQTWARGNVSKNVYCGLGSETGGHGWVNTAASRTYVSSLFDAIFSGSSNIPKYNGGFLKSGYELNSTY